MSIYPNSNLIILLFNGNELSPNEAIGTIGMTENDYIEVGINFM